MSVEIDVRTLKMKTATWLCFVCMFGTKSVRKQNTESNGIIKAKEFVPASTDNNTLHTKRDASEWEMFH